jgi:hypothetical protein
MLKTIELFALYFDSDMVAHSRTIQEFGFRLRQSINQLLINQQTQRYASMDHARQQLSMILFSTCSLNVHVITRSA